MPTFDELVEEVAALKRSLPWEAVPKSALRNWLETGAELDASALLQKGTIDDTALASPNNNVYKPIIQAQGQVAGEAAGAWFMIGRPGGAGDLVAVGTNTNIWSLPALYIDPADYSVLGKSARFRVRGTVFANVAGAGRTYAFALREITAVTSGGLDIGLTAAANYTGSATTTVGPAATSRNHVEGTDFAITAASYFALVVTPAGAVPGNERVLVTARLEYRSV